MGTGGKGAGTRDDRPIDVLHVDDDGALLDLTRDYLETEYDRFAVESVTDAEAALSELDDGGYDAVVSDYRMPGRDGLAFLERLREERGSSIPFVMFTGQGREEVAMRALNLGADRYLQKGGDPAAQYGVLAEAVTQAVEHRRTRAALERREADLRTTLESIGDGVITTDDEGRVTRMNDAAERMTGWSASAAAGRDFSTVFDARGADGERVAPVARALERDGTVEVPDGTVLRRRDGGTLYVGDSAAPIAAEGETRGVVVVFRDVTEEYRRRRRRRRQHEALVELAGDPAVTGGEFRRATERITETVVDVLDVDLASVWLFDDEGETLTAVTEHVVDEGVRYPDEALHWEDHGEYWDAIRNERTVVVPDVHEEPRMESFIEPFFEPQGIDAVLDAVVRSGGEMVGLLAAEQSGTREWTDDEVRFAGEAADLVRQAMANREVRRANERLRRLLDQSPMATIEWTPSLEVARWNEAATAVFGHEEEAALGREAPFVFPDAEGAGHLPDVGETDRTVTENVTADGERIVCEWHDRAVVEDGEVTGVLSMVQDVTERERTEEFLRDLHLIATDEGSFAARVERLLDRLRERLGLANGYLARVDPDTDTHEVRMAVAGDGDPPVGPTVDLSTTYCRHVVDRDEPVIVDDAEAAGYGDDVGYREYGIACYAGAPVYVDDDLWGTLCFTDPEPRPDAVDGTDVSMVELTADWIGRELGDAAASGSRSAGAEP